MEVKWQRKCQQDFATQLRSEIVASTHGFPQPTSRCWNGRDAHQRNQLSGEKMDEKKGQREEERGIDERERCVLRKALVKHAVRRESFL